MIKAVVFDIGGVILDLDMEVCKQAFKTRIGFETIDDYIDTYCQKGFWGDLESGKIDGGEFLSRCVECSRQGTTEADVLACFRDFLIGVDPAKIAFLKELSKEYPLYVLSNNNPVAMVYIRDFFRKEGADMDKIFTRMFLSYEMKTMKPSREIFEMAADGIGLPAEEVLFVDDSSRNIDVAASVGFKTLLYDPFTNLCKAVREALATF